MYKKELCCQNFKTIKVLKFWKNNTFLHMILYKFVTVCYVYTNGCLRSNVTPDDGHGKRPKHVEFLK
jgi:hypothetical protein